MDPQALIQQYQNEIAELKALLREKESGGEVIRTSKGDVGSLFFTRISVLTKCDVGAEERGDGEEAQ